MARINKNALVGQRGGDAQNERWNGGIRDCLRRYNAANCGAIWKTKGKWGEKSRKALRFDIKRKKP